LALTTLRVFTDFVCPWCYLGTARVEKLKQNFDIDVRWIYFPLHPDTPSEGLALKDLFAGRNFDLEAIHARLNALLDAEGLPHGPRAYTYNSRLAQELAKWSDSQPGGDAVHRALYRAYFVDARNIGDVEVLVQIAQSAGLSAQAAREVLASRSFRNAVDADWEEARRSGVTGVPSFIAGNNRVAGAQPYEVLAELLRTVRAAPKTNLEHA
jgi:predicted DsbA family dithiol-disulfide isomerase